MVPRCSARACPNQIASIASSSQAANSTTPQINRRKSARNLEVLQFDPSEPRAVFFDPKRGTRHTATLTECDCSDFNLAGTNPRKTFKPCMHIYRLAIELGLLEAKYLDHRARFALAGALSHEETHRLQQLPLVQPNGAAGHQRFTPQESSGMASTAPIRLLAPNKAADSRA